ncbi:metallophosphoesterase [Alistipes sp.]|uniref:metallophosphoesterase n=1 Tax=Alistipes sp. TaxID=1872444 RepID=UPI0025C67ED7|nr:metallophosphoesterase [Alistipes sp.]
MKKNILTILCCLTAVFSFAREKSQITVIMQVSDPQMGFYADNRNMDYEIRTLTKTVAAINNLRPDVVVFTGDYVHDVADEGQWMEFLRIVAGIAPSIKTLYLPGNHDVRLKEGSVDVEPYTKRLGADHFCVRVNGNLLTGINSNYLKDEIRDLSKEQNQFLWLTRSLKKNRRISLVFTHHPFFLRQIDELGGYSTISPEKRRRYFELFRKTGVQAVFAGHLHDNAEASYDNIGMITSSAVGRQLGDALSGVRIIVIKDQTIVHRYYSLDEIPGTQTELIQTLQ